MTGLKRLAKLRQYDGSQDLSDFMKTQHRQNMLSIESSLDDLSSPEVGCLIQFNALTIANNSRSQLVISSGFLIDNQGMIRSNFLDVKESGAYLFDFTFENLIASADRQINLEIYKNDSLVKSVVMWWSNSGVTTHIPVSFRAVLELAENDELSFWIYNDGFVSVFDASIDSGLLRMNKLET